MQILLIIFYIYYDHLILSKKTISLKDEMYFLYYNQASEGVSSALGFKISQKSGYDDCSFIY